MFKIEGINFSNGVYDPSNKKINGAEVAIMESAAKADTLIKDFENTLVAGMDPNLVVDKILQDRNYSESDFTDMDIHKINRRIEAIYKTVNNNERRDI